MDPDDPGNYSPNILQPGPVYRGQKKLSPTAMPWDDRFFAINDLPDRCCPLEKSSGRTELIIGI